MTRNKLIISIFLQLLYLSNANANSRIDSTKTSCSNEFLCSDQEFKNTNSKFGFDIFDLSKPRSGMYNEISRNTPPFTILDNGDVNKLVRDIRDNIIVNNGNYQTIYKSIFSYLMGQSSLPDCSHDAICNESYKSKAAAFTYLIGLEVGIDNEIHDLGDVGSPAREYYYNLSVGFLKNARTSSDRFNGLDRQRFRSFELIQYVQAYDYLYTTRYFSGVTIYYLS